MSRSVEHLKRFRFVEYRIFNFSHYPKHVSNLKTYAFKDLIIAEVMKEYSYVLWVDSSSSNLCWYKGKEYDLHYTLPSNSSVRGIGFSCSHMKYLDYFGFLNESTFIDLRRNEVSQVKVVTAITQDHFHECGRLLEKFKKHFKGEQIILYDLGLEEYAVKFLKKLKFVEYRKFDFSYYPSFVSNAKKYGFKWLVVAEVLKEYKSVIWADASLRFLKSNFMKNINKLLNCYNGKSEDHKKMEQRKIEKYHLFNNRNDKNLFQFNIEHCYKSQVLMHIPTFHGILSTANPRFLEYLPTDKSKYKGETSRQHGTGFVLFVKTKDTVENIMKWAVLCSLTEDCIAPVSWYPCEGIFNKHNWFANYEICYRFDQTLLTVLLHNNNNYDNRNYVTELKGYAYFNGNRLKKMNRLLKYKA
uniref:Beta-1,6-N-acetylglucosaminyltransferase n=1 Tax=Parastrongyloides trichosuri TaxID=131310 RepID=A0A0N4ZKZ8_PARTI